MPYQFNPFTGTLDLVPDTSAFAPAVPLSVASSGSFSVGSNAQVIWREDITVDGVVSVSGALVEAA